VQLLVRTLPFVAEEEVFARQLTEQDKQFLMSIKQGEPDWALHPVDGIERLPAVQWKLKNIQAMRADKHRAAMERLEKVLSQL
jgi:hypothetical protein